MGPKNGGFGENAGRHLRFWFPDPKKALSCAEPRRFGVFCVKIGALVSAVAFLKYQKIAELLCAEGRDITHERN